MHRSECSIVISAQLQYIQFLCTKGMLNSPTLRINTLKNLGSFRKFVKEFFSLKDQETTTHHHNTIYNKTTIEPQQYQHGLTESHFTVTASL